MNNPTEYLVTYPLPARGESVTERYATRLEADAAAADAREALIACGYGAHTDGVTVTEAPAPAEAHEAATSDYFSDLDACRAAGAEYARNGIAAGDTEPLESPFSGEWADGLTGQDVLDAAGIDARFDGLEDFEQADVLDAWEAGYLSAEWPDTRWVSVVFVDGDDYDTAVDAANDAGGSVDAVIEYLSQWDYGQETDDAHTTDAPQWGSADTLHIGAYGGIEYTLGVNHHLGYYSLNRRPLAL